MSGSKSNKWIVGLSCVIINFLLMGIPTLSPLLFVESMRFYNVDRRTASFPFVLVYMIRNLSGPLVGYLGRKFGVCRITMFGCVLSAIGIGACSFAQDITSVAVFWGLIFGLGFGMGSLLLPVILNSNFVDSQSSANGIALAGSSIGEIILPPLFGVALKTYGLSGTFLILCGYALHAIPTSMLLRTKPDSNSDINETSCNHANPNHCNANPLLKRNVELKKPSLSSKMDKAEMEQQHLMVDSTGFSEKYEMSAIKREFISQAKPDQGHNADIFQKGSIPSTKYKEIITADHSSSTIIVAEEQHHSATSSQRDETQTSACGTLKSLVDPIFILISLYHGIYLFIIITTKIIFVDFLRDKAFDGNYEIYYYSGFNLTSMFGRLLLGFVTDRGLITVANFLIFEFFLIGLMLFAVPWIHSRILLITVLLLFSFILSGPICSLPASIHLFIEPEFRTMVLSSRNLLYAPLSLLTSPMIGYFRGTLGSYDGIFFVLTATSFFSCVLIAIVSYSVKRRKVNQCKQNFKT